MRILLLLSFFAISVLSFSALAILRSKNRRWRVCWNCFWVGFLRSVRFVASCLRLMSGISGGFGVASVKVANVVN